MYLVFELLLAYVWTMSNLMDMAQQGSECNDPCRFCCHPTVVLIAP